MSTVVLSVPGAHCGVCRRVILKALLTVPGVKGADVDLRQKDATVRIDAGAVTAAALCDQLGRAGYAATPLGSDDADPTNAQDAPNPTA